MKKVLFLFCIALFAISCDPSFSLYFRVNNLTDKDIAIELEGDEGDIYIEPGGNKIIHHISYLGSDNTDRLEGQGDAILLNGKMIQEDTVIPDEIWKRKYWEFSSNKSSATYSLTITNGLIESILSEQ